MVTIPLTQGKVAVVDDCDAHLARYRWCVHFNGRAWYAKRRAICPDGRSIIVRLHRVILDIKDPSIEVDHINRDGLDCRRCNLRLATHAQNAVNSPPCRRNTSGFKGVSWDKTRGQWQAGIVTAGRRKALGRFSRIEDAARAYDDAARRVHGAFAWLNFP